MQDTAQRERFEAALTDEAYQRAWHYCCRLAGTREDAEDLLQDALAHAFLKFDQLSSPVCFTPWLMSIVRTRFLNELRRPRHQPAESYWLDTVETQRRDEPGTTPLADALRRLPAGQRELLCLFYIDGLSQAELGIALSIPVPAVGQRLFRARRALQRLLGACPAWGAELQG